MKVGPKKILIMAFTVLLSVYVIGGFTLLAGHYDQDGIPVKTTPYDRQHREVRKLTCLPCHNMSSVAYDRQYRKVRKYLETASRFQYKADTVGGDYWQTPYETEKLSMGDCEDKAIWLYSELIKEGFEDIRLVLGNYRRSRSSFHMWVNWYHNGKVFILDPTDNEGIWRADEYPKDFYEPSYSFYKDKSWKHGP
jgi:predicted transglutaminase-like cysteine proteinase